MNSVGLIGCGSIANISYGGVLNTWFKDAAKYFYDINEASAKSLSYNLAGKSVSLDELITRSDFIIIATTPDSHYELLQKAIQPGKTIICEKPFLLKYEHAKEIIALASTTNARVFAAHVRRFFPAPELARNFMETGLLGAVLKIDLFEGGRFSWESQSGYHANSPLGGVLPDTGSHSIDTLLYVLGLDTTETEITVSSRERMPANEPSHVFNANFTIKGEVIDALASIRLSRRNSLSNKINIYCENGVMEVPLDIKNAVKVSTPKGNSILRKSHPAQNITDAFNNMFYHIMNEGGALLDASGFLNTTKLLETLLIESR